MCFRPAGGAFLAGLGLMLGVRMAMPPNAGAMAVTRIGETEIVFTTVSFRCRRRSGARGENQSPCKLTAHQRTRCRQAP